MLILHKKSYKKGVIALAFFMALSLIPFPAMADESTLITVQSPAEGDIWITGTSRQIAWNFPDAPGSEVKIELLAGAEVSRSIADNAITGEDGNGIIEWTVPGDLTPGEYSVRITSLTNTGSAVSRVFTVSPPLPASEEAGAMTAVVAPSGGENWGLRTSRGIEWTYSGDPGSDVKIELIKNDESVLIITDSVSIGQGGSGNFNWTLPAGLTPGDGYRIRVTSLEDAADSVCSEAFTVISPLRVTDPAEDSSLTAGAGETLAWSFGNADLGDTFRIELFRDGTPLNTVAESVPAGPDGTGSCDWTVPTDLTRDGAYQFKISSVKYPEIAALSGIFTLSREDSAGETASFTILNDFKALSAPVTGDGYSFDPDSGTLTVTSDNGSTNWRSDAGIAKTAVLAVVVENGVLNILDNAFDGCTALTSATLPAGLTQIGQYAFYNCTSLQTAVIPNGVTTLKYGAFRNCSTLTSVTIPSSVSTIEGLVFRSCSQLSSATFLRMVAPTFGVNVFTSCAAGFKIYYPTGAKGYTSLGYTAVETSMALDPISGDGYSFDPNSRTLTVTSDNGTTNWRYDGSFDKTSVLNVVVQSGVLNIMESSFSGCTALTGVTLPAGLSVIRSYAFENDTALEMVAIPNGVSSLWYGAFKGCTKLTAVTIPGSVTALQNRVFYGCSQLSGATFMRPAAPTFGSDVFTNCAAGFKIYYPIGGTGYTGLGYTAEAIDVTLATEGYSFDSATGTLTIASNDGTINWRNSSVAKDAVKSVVIESGVTTILDNAFKDCTSLDTVTIPDGVTIIGKDAFYGCFSLTEAALPDTLLNIGDRAFMNCIHLEKISIPDGVTTIGSDALANTAISAIIIPNSVVSMNQGVFCYCSKLTSVTFETGCQLTSIPIFTFSDSGLASITIPDSVTAIQNGAFQGCTALTSVTIPGSVSTVKINAFQNCIRLYAATFEGMAAPAFGTGVFDNCHSKFTIYYSAGGMGYDNLGYPALAGKAPVLGDGYYFNVGNGTLTISSDSGLVNWKSDGGVAKKDILAVVIENGVHAIGDEAFQGCSALNAVSIPGSVGSIGSAAFDGCSSLKAVSIPGNVTAIGSYAFRNCVLISTATIPQNVDAIGTCAFYGCSQLSSAYFMSMTAPALGMGVFDNCRAGFTIYYPAGGTGYGSLGYPAVPLGKTTYTLTVIGGTGSGEYEEGAHAGIKADTAPAGKKFDCWVSSNGGAFDDAASASTNFIMPAAAVTVTAQYRDETTGNGSGDNGSGDPDAGGSNNGSGIPDTGGNNDGSGVPVANSNADGNGKNLSRSGRNKTEKDGTEPSENPENSIPPVSSPDVAQTTAPSESGTIEMLKPSHVEKNEETGVITVVLDLSMLPEGTTAIQLENGSIIPVDAGSSTVKFEISGKDVDEDGTVKIMAVGQDGVPLGTYILQVTDADKAVSGVINNANGKMPILPWMIGMLAVAAVGAAVTVVILRKRKKKIV